MFDITDTEELGLIQACVRKGAETEAESLAITTELRQSQVQENVQGNLIFEAIFHKQREHYDEVVKNSNSK